ncbi:MAG: hypothetical protein ABIF10_06940, partial [Candidatus Woesearchaeota archaeon]
MKRIIFAIMFILTIAAVSAYPVQISIQGGTLYTQLASGSCSISQSGNSYTINGYGSCMTHEWVYRTCMPGYTGYTTTDDNTGYGPWPINYNLKKMPWCMAEVCCIKVVPDRVRVGTPISISANIASPLDFGGIGPTYAPSSISNYYSVDTRADLIVDGSVQQSQTKRVPYSTTTDISFTYVPQTCGTHTLTVQTNVPDCQCETSRPNSVTDTIQAYVCELDSGWGDGHQYSCNADRTYNQCNGDGCGYSKVNLCEHNCGADYECDGIAPGQGNCDSQCKWHAVCGDGKISD